MTIFVKDLTFEAIIGLLPEERVTPQRVIFDGSFTCKDIPLSIDYAQVVSLVKQTIIQEEFKTVEEALLMLEPLLKTQFPSITSLKLSLSKPDILPECTVGARLEKIY
ncbi:MAG: dihydroneopterin aldolase [Campylobacterales bacterium]|nr:dihydroneopterin aldolase [Campylobacterales bacterium]